MYKRRIFPLLIICILIVSLMITGCTKKTPTNLEEYIRINQSEQDAIQGLIYNDTNATVSVEGNTMVITYMVEDDSVSGDDLNKALESLENPFKEIIADLEGETGLQGIGIKVVYKNSANKEIAGRSFE